MTPPCALSCLTRELRRGERRTVERRHRALAVERPADRRSASARAVCASRRGRGEDERRGGNDARAPARPCRSRHVSPLRSAAHQPRPSVLRPTAGEGAPDRGGPARRRRDPRASPGTRCRRRRCRRRSRGRRSRPSPRLRARRGSRASRPRRRRAGRGRPSRASARASRSRARRRSGATWRSISSSRSGVFQRCQTSNWIPTAPLPTSSIERGGVGERVQERPVLDPLALERLEREPDAGALGLGGDRAQAVDDDRARRVRVAVAGGAGEADDRGRAEGASGAPRRRARRSARAGRSGPAAAAAAASRGPGTAEAEPSPLAASCSSAGVGPSPSFSSQTPIPSTPAPAYARTSSAKLAASVLTCEIENGGSVCGSLDTRRSDRVTRLTSDQVWFTLDLRGSRAARRATDGSPPDDGRGRARAPARGDHPRRADSPGTPLRLEDLARSLGMSISPIREAVRQLEALGLAEHVPHHGAKVMGLDVEELRELFSIRLALETLAVRRAAELFEPRRTRSRRGRTWPRSTRPATAATSAAPFGRTPRSTSRSTRRRARPGSCA